MKKSLLIMSLPILALGLTGCDRAEAPKSIKIYGVEAALIGSRYQYHIDFGGKGLINQRVKWEVDNTSIANIDEDTGELTIRKRKLIQMMPINITATSRADSSVKDTLKINVYPGNAYESINDFLLDLRNMEDDLYTKYIDKTSTFNVPVLCGEGDYINFLNRKFLPDSSTSRYTLEKAKGIIRVEGGLSASFVDSRAGSKMKIGKTFELKQREFVGSELLDYVEKEKEGTGFYNCFQYDSDGDLQNDSIGYYTYAAATEDLPSSFNYYTFKGGLMTSIIEVKNDVVCTYLHVTIAD